MILHTERLRSKWLFLLLAGIFLTASCQNQTAPTVSNTADNQPATVSNTQPQQPTPAPSVESEQQKQQEAINLPVTLPVLDAMFADENFASELKSKLGLTDEQIAQLKQTAHEAIANLKETSTPGSTAQATQTATEKINSIVGADKAAGFADFVRERWEKGSGEEKTNVTASNAAQPNAIPTDTRVVVNAPAYRMDLFKDGQLVRSYKIGIGYPEFPLPTAMRQATTLIFNPTWTPPDEPWVEGSKKVKAGQKVEAGSPLNPLGPVKIPIGSPSLIHGGKVPAKLGGFASHGCVGLTSPQVLDFTLALAQLTGTPVTFDDITNYAKDNKTTKNVKLNQPIPVELRYETIVVENGVLKIYRDVYERGTNTEENLKKVLDAYGVSLDSLSEPERAKIMTALKQMAVDAGGNAVEVQDPNKKSTSKTVTRNIVGKKEIDIPLAALKGKGYPAPVDLNVGTRTNKPLKTAMKTDSSTAAANSNQAVQKSVGAANSNSAGKK